jgi:hypothetical protein
VNTAVHRTLDTPDGETTLADTGMMGEARQASAPAIDGFVLQLKAEGHDEGEDTFEERIPIAKQLEIRRFALEIDSDGAIFSCRFAPVSICAPSVIRSWKLRRDSGGKALQSQDYCEGLRVLPLKAMEGGHFGDTHAAEVCSPVTCE